MGQSIENRPTEFRLDEASIFNGDSLTDDRIHKTMGLHPGFSKLTSKMEDFLMGASGPLHKATRHYIAIMAAARHQCRYIIDQHKKEYLSKGGDPSWLQGLDAASQKLRKLSTINKVLAHRPWLLSTDHIKALTHNGGNNDAWSMGELVQAIVILAHYHGVCSFVGGTGLAESCTTPFKESPPSSPVTEVPPKSANGSPKDIGLDALMLKMRTLEKRQEETTLEEQLKRYEHVNKLSAEILLSNQAKDDISSDDLSRFLDDPDFHYVDFSKRGDVSPTTFRVQDFSWDEHGYSLANRFYPNVADLLDDVFKLAYNMTYHTLGHKRNVDTSLFRRAIWNYIHCMFGIRWDDYDYGEVNQLLERPLKAYIKSAVCFPERVTRKDYSLALREFKHSEKVHVNLMILEARVQAELLYALRAIYRYMR
ncbi:sestrin-2-like [Artemia franciscana]|uniref:Sestrin n=1 Tax=Artemia franciscana TaxID=6661 RepID=A0AA88LC35_ARTSF|nr:hypothetical protein QYM36_010490 [Artemia franciscana]